MKKMILSISILLLFCGVVNAEEVKQKTDEELIAEILKYDEESEKAKQKIHEAKAKTKALEKLEKTVDKLGKTLQVAK